MDNADPKKVFITKPLIIPMQSGKLIQIKQ